MAKKVELTGTIVGGYEFSEDDLTMARAWYNAVGHKTLNRKAEPWEEGEEPSVIHKGRTPDAILIKWVELDEPKVELPKKYIFETGDRGAYNAWLQANKLEASDENKAKWFELDKPIPEGYKPSVAASTNPDDVLATVYGIILDDEGNPTDEQGEVNVTREMLSRSRGKGAKGAASAETLVTAANVDDAMENLAPTRMVRGDTVLTYSNGAWMGATATKKALLDKTEELQNEVYFKENELERVKALREKEEAEAQAKMEEMQRKIDELMAAAKPNHSLSNPDSESEQGKRNTQRANARKATSAPRRTAAKATASK